MKKSIMILMALAMSLVMALALCACGGKSDDSKTSSSEQKETPAANESNESKYTCETFEVEIPDGWSVATESSDYVKLVNAASKDDFDSFKNASLEITVGKVAYYNPEGSGTIEKLVENDKQFFKDKTPEITDFTLMDVYTGKALTGISSTHANCNLVYYDLLYQKPGSTDGSVMKIRKAYYSDDQLKEIDKILGTLNVFALSEAATSDNAESVDSGKAIELQELVTVTVPSGWEVNSESSSNVKLKNPAKFSSGSVTVQVMMKTKDAATWAEDQKNNFGGKAEISTREYNGITYKVVTVSGSSQEYAFADVGEGNVIKVSTMAALLDQVTDVLEGIKVK